MDSFAVRIGDIDEWCLCLFEKIRDFVYHNISNGALPEQPTCHQVCAFVICQYPTFVKHVRGSFALKGFEHSWLQVNGRQVIIDAYPWAASGPFMVTMATGSPWRHLYLEQESKHAADEAPRD